MKTPTTLLTVSALCAGMSLLPLAASARGHQGPRDEASAHRGHHDDGHDDDHDHGDRSERRAMRERARQKLHAHVHEELTARVGLSEEKSRALAEVMKRRGQEREAHGQRVRQEMKRLRDLVKNEAEDAALQAQMERIAQVRQEKREDAQGLLEETRSFLSPREQARLMLALPKVMRETRRLIRQSRHGSGRGHGFGHPERYPDGHPDPEDDLED